MKKIATILAVIVMATIANAQITIPLGTPNRNRVKTHQPVPSLREQLAEEFDYAPTEGFSLGLGMEVNAEHANFLICTQAYHLDLMWCVGLDRSKSEGCWGQQYSSVMASYSSCGFQYLGSYRTGTMTIGGYFGYLIKRFSIGCYIGAEWYNTGQTYGNPNGVSGWDAIFSVNGTGHGKCVYGIYTKFFLSPHGHIFVEYKVNNGFGGGIIFTFGG